MKTIRCFLAVLVVMLISGFIVGTNVARASYHVVEDFEEYANTTALKAVWQTQAPADINAVSDMTCQQIHSGNQAMALKYNNSLSRSEAFADTTGPNSLDFGTNWTLGGVSALSLWFRGMDFRGSFTGLDPYTLTGDGSGIFNTTSDSFYFVYSEVAASRGKVIARVDSIDATNSSAMAGVMFRDSLDPNSKYAAVVVTPDNRVIFMGRNATGGNASAIATVTDVNMPHWVSITNGVGPPTQWRAYHANDVGGSPDVWTQIDSSAFVSLTTPISLGLCVTSSSYGEMCTAEFSNVQMQCPIGTAIADPNTGTDIGNYVYNDPEAMYVVLQDNDSNGIVYYENKDDTVTQTGEWTEWRIDLNDFIVQGVDPCNVRKMYIGIGDKSVPSSGSGTMYFDDIRLFTTGSVKAFNPNPSNGAACVDPDTYLSWSPGCYAASHEVYFDTVKVKVQSRSGCEINGVSCVDPCYILPLLETNTTYYWAIDEVGSPTGLWPGDVWSFTTSAADIEWDCGGGDRLWNTATNWSPDIVPYTHDWAIVDLPDPNCGCLIDYACNAVCEKLTVGLNNQPCCLDITGGSLSVATDFIIGENAGSDGRVNVNSGTVSVGANLTVGKDGTGTLNVVSELLNIEGCLEVGKYSTGVMNLGSVISCHELEMGSEGRINIYYGGMVRVDDPNGLVKAIVDGYVANGWIACAKPDCNSVSVEWDDVDKVTLVRCFNCGKATNPVPPETRDRGCVDHNVDLWWLPHIFAISHELYLGTNYSKVFDATRDEHPDVYYCEVIDHSYDPGPLDCNTIYYWRVDTICQRNIMVKGDVWSFRTCPCPNCVDPPKDMVAWWPLDEPIGPTSKDIAGDNDGTWIGSLTPVENGMVKGALAFGGVSHYVEVPHHESLNLEPGGLSIDAWLFMADSSSWSGLIVQKGGTTGPGYQFHIDNSGLLCLALTDDWKSWIVWSDYSVPTGRWTHVAVTATWERPLWPLTVSFYIDGQYAGGGIREPNSLSNTEPLWIGGSPYSSFKGIIDELEIYKRALTGDEVRAIFEAGREGKCRCPTKTYDDEADWNDPNAEFAGVRIDPNGCLELLDPNDPCAATPYRYAWLANSGEGTVSKVDIDTGNEVARYRTGPPYDKNSGCKYLSPSRTTVDANGNCWVANRAILGKTKYQGSVTKILLDPPFGKPTSNSGDGIIDPTNNNELLDWGKDYAVERHYLVGGTSIPRALAVDHDGFLWVGLNAEQRCVKLDPKGNSGKDFSPVSNSKLKSYPYPPDAPRPTELASVDLRNLDTSGNPHLDPYGMALSPNGRLYVSELADQGWIVEIDPVSAEVCQSHHVPAGQPYGIAVDRNCIVWTADLSQGRCIRWNPMDGAGGFSLGTGAAGRGRGITAHPNGGIWMACDDADKVAKFDGSLVTPVATNYPTGGGLQMADGPVGIGVCSDGSIMAVGQNNNTWSKLSAGPSPPEGTEIILDWQKQKTGPSPYTYSDFTGSIANQARQQGFWTVIFDSGILGTNWGRVSWASENDNPPETSVSVAVRAADAIEGLGGSYTNVENGIWFKEITGQYIQIRVQMSRNRPPSTGNCEPPGCGAFPPSPKLCELRVDANCAPCDVICPDDVSVSINCLPGQRTAIVNYPPVEFKTGPGCELTEPVYCNHASGDWFPLGTTTVTCYSYVNGQLVECSFDVTVDCKTPTGACCHKNAMGTLICEEVTEEECATRLGTYGGNYTDCASVDYCQDAIPIPIPIKNWWTLDEWPDVVASDMVGFNNEARYVGSPTPIEGKVNSGLSFDGSSDYLEIDDHPEINFGTGDLSIDAWIRTSSTDTYEVFVDKRDHNTVIGYEFLLYHGKLLFELADSGGWTNYYNPASADLRDGAWHFVAVTVDRDEPSGGKLYCDGELIHTFNPTIRAGDISNPADLWIGRHHPVYIYPVEMWFDGDLDEIEMFKAALTEDEIQMLFDANGAGKARESAHVTQFVPSCQDKEGTMMLKICNFTAREHSYFWYLDGNMRPGCDSYGPLGSMGVENVQARHCKSITIPFNCPSALSKTGCSRVVVQNLDTGSIISSNTVLRLTPMWCFDVFDGPGEVIYFSGSGSTVLSIGFEVTNTDDLSGTVEYEIEAREPNGTADNHLISLNGLPAGTKVVDTLSLAVGETAELSVNVEFTEYQPFTFFDIVFLADSDDDGQKEEVASASVRSVLCGETIDDSRRKGDMNLDCEVNYDDLKIIADNWLMTPPPNPNADLYVDNRIDFRDIAILADNWLKENLWP